jgi:plastocyanin
MRGLFALGVVMVEIGGWSYPDSFGGVPFEATTNQTYKKGVEFSDEVIVGGAVSGLSYTFRDWYASPPDVLDLDILVPDRATFEALAELRGYAASPYELVIPAQGIDWTASLDELTANGAYLDTPLKCHVVFTKVADLGLTAPTSPTTVTASFVFGVDGLDAEFDANGASSSDGQIDVVNWEFGDSNIATQTGPWETGGSNIPTQLHTYAAPGEYVVNCSVERNGVTSDNFSVVVVVT